MPVVAVAAITLAHLGQAVQAVVVVVRL